MIARTLSATCSLLLAVVALPAAAAARTAVATPTGTNWGDTANGVRGQNGSQFVYVCPAGGSLGRLWGTGPYTDDSSICTAATHAGRITQAAGGIVTIQPSEGLSSYGGSTQNGVTSTSYGSWPGSFSIVAVTSGGGANGVSMGGSGWGLNATAFRGNNGSRYAFVCPAQASGIGRIWGSTPYTDDSSVCGAAVHIGLITQAAGGTVTIEIRPGASSYSGTTRNGMTTASVGSFSGSFIFPGSAAPPSKTVITTPLAGHTWNADARPYRGHIGKRLRYSCPAAGTFKTVWGSGVYTDDSSVCTAAVHAGRISRASGGAVMILIRAGRSSYASSSSHGVTTKPYGSWPGSFVFVSS